jgi:hypothetical protein
MSAWSKHYKAHRIVSYCLTQKCVHVLFIEKKYGDVSDELAVISCPNRKKKRFLIVEISFLCLKGFKFQNGNVCSDVVRD